MEGFVVDGDGEGGVVLVVDADNSAAQAHAPPPNASSHFLLAKIWQYQTFRNDSKVKSMKNLKGKQNVRNKSLCMVLE